jgi:hypothetical protein
VRFACNRALWIEKGRIRRLGPAAEVAEEYEQYMIAKSDVEGEVLSYDDRVKVLSFDVPDRLVPSEPLVIDAELEFTAPVERPIFKLHLHSNVGDSLVFSHHSNLEGCEWPVLEGRFRLRMSTIPLHLRPGKYPITFNVSERDVNRHLIWHFKKYVIEVTGDRQVLGIMDAAVKYELTKQ